MSPLLNFLQQRLWPVAIGALLAGVLLLLLGNKGVWGLLLLLLAAGVILRTFVPPIRPEPQPVVPKGQEGILTPLVRRGLEAFDLEYDAHVFTERLPRVRIIPIDRSMNDSSEFGRGT